MSFVDSHCHLDRIDLRPHGGEFARLVDACEQAGVTRLLCVSIDLQAYPGMRALIAPFERIDVSVGVHPSAEVPDEPAADELLRLADDARVCAIGETGLDYARADAADSARQRARFRTHIAVARACGKPLIVHTRAAREDTIALLREEDAGRVGGVMHCFTETWEMARAALDLGFYISFSGILTFKNADELREVARQVPPERLLIETDSPYLAPVPHRGRPNEPRWLPHVAECLAALRGLSVPQLAALTAENYARLFARGGVG